MQGRPFVLLGINAGDQRQVAKESVQENKLNWRSFFDGDSGLITGLFKVQAFPTVMLIDHQGRIVYPNLRGKQLISEIKRLVKAAEDDGMQGEKVAAKLRTFRDRTGKHRIEAIAIAGNNEQVKLKKRDGETVVLSLVDLSRSDQDYLRTVELADLPEQFIANAESTTNSEFRVFVDSTGKHKVEAVFVKIEDGKVTLRKRDGTLTTLLLSRLSDDDKEFLRGQNSGF